MEEKDGKIVVDDERWEEEGRYMSELVQNKKIKQVVKIIKGK
jgi:hypothetical protein